MKLFPTNCSLFPSLFFAFCPTFPQTVSRFSMETGNPVCDCTITVVLFPCFDVICVCVSVVKPKAGVHQPRFDSPGTLRSSPAATNLAEDASVSARSSLIAKPALSSLMFGPHSAVNQYSAEPDAGNLLLILLSIIIVFCSGEFRC